MNFNFDIIENQNKILRSHFFESCLNENIHKPVYDIQGNYWTSRTRNEVIKLIMDRHKGFRCVKPITEKETYERNLFHLKSKSEQYYQFHSFIKNLRIWIYHFQLRKNLKLIDNELFYSKKNGIESFDIITNKQQTLYYLDDDEEDSCICYELKKAGNDFFVILGKSKSDVEIIKVDYEDYKEKKKKKYVNKVPKNEMVSRIQFEGEVYINFLKCLSNERLIVTSNDKTFKIVDLNNSNKIIYDLLNECPINHCDFNENRNLLITSGDSVSVQLFDIREKREIKKLSEFYDYGTCIGFNPYDDNYFAAGGQDLSCRIWDIRRLDQSMKVLYGQIDSIGTLQWLNKQQICYGENILFAYIYDIMDDKKQDLSYIGYLSGMEYQKQGKKIYLSIQDEKGGIICYEALSGCHSLHNVNF